MITEERLLYLFAQMQTQLLGHMDERFRAMDEKWEGRVGKLESRFDGLEAKFEKLQEEMREGFREVNTNLKQHDQRLQNLEVGEEKIMSFMKERFEKNEQILDERFNQVYDTIRQSEEDQETNFNQVLRAMNKKRR